MSVISKRDRKNHDIANDLLWGSNKPLTGSEVSFVYENWLPYVGETNIGETGAYFTPVDYALCFAHHTGSDGRLVDLCSGIGVLLWGIMLRNNWGRIELGNFTELVAVEFNPEFVKVGQRLLPMVNWILGDVTDMAIWQELGPFTHAVSNPPFGKSSVKSTSQLRYRGASEWVVAEIGLRVAETLVMILPQESVPPMGRSAVPNNYDRYNERIPTEYRKFKRLFPSAEVGASSVNTTIFNDQWKGTAIKTEIISIDTYNGLKQPFGLEPLQ